MNEINEIMGYEYNDKIYKSYELANSAKYEEILFKLINNLELSSSDNIDIYKQIYYKLNTFKYIINNIVTLDEIDYTNLECDSYK